MSELNHDAIFRIISKHYHGAYPSTLEALDNASKEITLLIRTHEAAHGELVKTADDALLLAARWFKIHFDYQGDEPPTKDDLSSMLNAMVAARQALAKYQGGE